jgi:Type ISP C-terminal specificity domain
LVLRLAYDRRIAEFFFCGYVVAVAAHPAYTARFQKDLSTPGLRIPVTRNAGLFARAVQIGREVIWLHTFGERMIDPARGRPAQPPRATQEERPYMPEAGGIPVGTMPDTLKYDATNRRLHVGVGHIDNVNPAVWAYGIDGKQVLTQWFSYRKADRERPLIGERRKPSSLGNIQPSSWLAEYTTELLNVLHVLTLLVSLEPSQHELLEKICTSPLVSAAELEAAGAFEVPAKGKKVAQPATMF